MKAIHKLLMLFFVCFTLLIVVSKVLNVGYRKLYQPTYETLSKIFEDTLCYNTLLIGNSKVEFGINPFYIDSIARLNAINFGYAASNFPTHHLLLKSYLKNHKPPVYLVLGIENNMFFTAEDQCNKLPLYDYLNRVEVTDYFDSLQLSYKLQKYIPFSKFIFMDDYSRFGILSAFRGKGLFQTEDIYHYKGFYIGKKNRAPIPFIPRKSVDTAQALNSFAIAQFEGIWRLCKKHQITLLLTFPPMPHSDGKSNFYCNHFVDDYLQQKQLGNSLYVLRNDTNRTFQASYFVDASHLNFEGSVKYSVILAKFLDSLQRRNVQ